MPPAPAEFTLYSPSEVPENRRSRSMRRLRTILLWSMLAGLGCAKSGARLEGIVTLDGNPIAAGKLQFVPQGPERRPAVSVDIKDGRYSASTVPLGKVQVLFFATKKTGRLIREYSQPYEETVNIIPKAYHDGITIEVTGDESTRDFELTSR
jgi:hypothetical protein